MMYRIAAVSSHFILEIVIANLFLFLFFIGQKRFPPILLFSSLGFISIILFFILLERFASKGKWLFLVIILPAIVIIGHLGGLSLFFASVIGLFVFWRGISIYDESSGLSKTILLFFSFTLGIIALVYSAMISYPYQNAIIFQIILFIVVIITDGFCRKWSAVTNDKAKFAFYFFRIMASVTVIGIAFMFLLKYIQLIFSSILQGIVFLFSGLAVPVIRFIEFALSLFGSSDYKPTTKVGEGTNEGFDYQPRSFEVTENVLYFLALCTVVGFVIYLLRKKSRLKESGSHFHHSVIISEGEPGGVFTSIFKRKGVPPDDFIRKEIFRLEKFAKRLRLGRAANETLKEWRQRTGLHLSNETIQVYERVRYGGDEASIEDKNYVQQEAQALKLQLKEIRKEQKK
ncbi:DUF4129 domain-containing protein [Neobacillus sp. GCM10023253]|uniref:DUF4129 domain-containing protein n=1 Tax=Neobacillus sp. GCM10023253 TaxID=3252644 RepID=UPI003612C59F